MNRAAAPMPVPEIRVAESDVPIHIEVTRVFCFVRRRWASPVATCLEISHVKLDYTLLPWRQGDVQTQLRRHSDSPSHVAIAVFQWYMPTYSQKPR
jgi:hypothetical protein